MERSIRVVLYSYPCLPCIPPTLDPKLEHIMPQIASMGAGVAVSDFNRDGWPDFYVTSSGEDSLNALYRNNRDGTFTNVAPELGVAYICGISVGILVRSPFIWPYALCSVISIL